MTHYAHKGFSTLELMIAFALMSLVFGGVILAHFGSSYWAIAAQTSNEGLYKAKTQLERMRALVHQDFRLARSAARTQIADASCAASGLCYFLQTKVDDLSPCSKYVSANVDWQVPGYPTTQTSLFTNLTDAPEAILLGGDCPLQTPTGAWSSVLASATFPSTMSGSPQAIDELGTVVYAGTDAAPYLQILNPTSNVTFANGFNALLEPVNGIDVARDLTNGRTYAYLAMASTTYQLAIVDVTDPQNPELVVKVALAGVSGPNAEGWRIAYYDRKVYITTRDAAGAEFHIINVAMPSSPVEYASPLNLDTSIYSLLVREQKINNVSRRFVYAADTLDSGEVKVLEVTNPAAPILVATLDLPDQGCSLADKPGGKAVYVAGDTLYVGRDHSNTSCAALPDLYSIDITNPLAPTITSSAVAGGGIVGLRASGDFLYALVSSQATPEVGSLLDINASRVYIAKNTTNKLEVWKIQNNMLPASALASYTMPGAKVQSLSSL